MLILYKEIYVMQGSYVLLKEYLSRRFYQTRKHNFEFYKITLVNYCTSNITLYYKICAYYMC